MPFVEENYKSRDALIAENVSLRQRIAELEAQQPPPQTLEAQWRESERRFRTLVDNLPGAVYRCHLDEQWSMVFLSDGIEALSGYRAQDLIDNQNLSYADLIHPEDQEQVEIQVQKAVDAGQPFLLNYRIRCRDGQEKWVWERGCAVGESDDLMLEGFILDVSDQHQNSELRLALENEQHLRRAKNQFVSMMSHEFRNPLAAIGSSLQILDRYADRISPERRKDTVAKIQDQVDCLIDLLNDTLSIFQADLAGIDPVAAPVDPLALYREVIQDARLIDSHSHRIKLHHQGDFEQAYLDKKLLRRCMSNLLSNAIKYSPPDSLIQVELLSNGEDLTFRVRDKGIGIPEQDQQFLFEAFHRASNVGQVQGTGLGLVIVRQAVEAQGGSIDCHSEVGIGTTFTVTLPLQVESA